MNTNTLARLTIQIDLIALLIGSSVCVLAQDKDWRSAIQDSLESQYALTKASADRSTIVTAGAVLVLKKDDLVMFTASNRTLPGNTYKDGRITQGFFGTLGKTANDGTTRTFVRGEKFWLTKVEVKDDGVVLQFLSDPFSDVRFAAALRFPFTKGSPPSADQISQTVAQVLAVDNSAAADPQPLAAPVGTPVSRSRSAYVPPAYPQTSSPAVQAQMQLVIAQLEATLQTAPTPEAQARIRAIIERMKASQGLAAAPPAAPPAAPAVEAPPPPIAPPPPPPPDPVVETKSIEVGQTKEQVEAIMGKPDKTVKVGTREIYQYKDLKVTFVNGKMTDAQ